MKESDKGPGLTGGLCVQFGFYSECSGKPPKSLKLWNDITN